MALSCGIVGLPNVGKSTIFNALTRSHSADAQNFPFCTIDPNLGIVELPDHRFDQLANIIQPLSRVPATVEFTDIAGLVEGASKGEGLGNQFLAHIRRVNAILHVVCCFEDPNVAHVLGSIDPVRDVEIIELELILADQQVIQKRMQKLEKMKKANNKEAILEAETLQKIMDSLSEGKNIHVQKLTDRELKQVTPMDPLTLKSVLFIGNIHEKYIADPLESEHFRNLRDLSTSRNAYSIPVSGKIESELIGLQKEEEKEFLKELNLSESGLNRVIRETHKLLGYITFFTAGKQEVRAWNIIRGTSAYDAAAEIHTDIQRGFIKAEVTSFSDFLQYKDLKKVQEAGKMRLEGKDYIVQDGDIIYFRFNI